MASPSSPTLQRLNRLNRSSPGFTRQLDSILNGQGYRKCVSSLKGDDLMWFVNYLDKVVDDLGLSNPVSRKCSSELKAICGSKIILPTSYMLPPHALHVSPETFASGGYGDVYQASFGGSRVRAKRVRVPHPKYMQSAEKAFCEGAITWKHLKHPNIAHLLGFTITPLQLVSEWMPNGNIPDYAKKNPRASIVRLLSGVANGIYYLHSCDVIHMEIKGTNVLVDAAGHARITDFGLAAITTRENFAMSPYQPEYSPRWTAPEVLRERAYSKAADIFSFAMLMAEVFTGAVPFSHLPGFNAALAIIEGRRPSRPVHPALTERLWELMLRCWDGDPRSRPEAAEVSRSLLASSA